MSHANPDFGWPKVIRHEWPLGLWSLSLSLVPSHSSLHNPSFSFFILSVSTPLTILFNFLIPSKVYKVCSTYKKKTFVSESIPKLSTILQFLPFFSLILSHALSTTPSLWSSRSLPLPLSSYPHHKMMSILLTL